MARNLQARHHAVTVRDIRSEAQDQALALGMAVAASPAELAAAVEVIAIVVVNATQIADVLFGTPDCPGIVSGSRAGQIVLLCSTIAPGDTIAFAEKLAASGLVVLDAPISGGPARALSGAMSMMLAGPQSVLDSLDGLLADLAQSRFHLGEKVGDAAKAKLVNNLLAGINLAAGAEALALGLEEYEGDGLMLIEWGDKFPEILPQGTLRISIIPRSDDSRLITLHVQPSQ